MNIKKILYPTDFSIISYKAREHAIYLAQQLDARVFILHAIEPLDYEEIDDEIKKFYKDLQLNIDEKILIESEKFIEAGIEVNTKVVIGPRWRTINTFAREYQTDLIIMGSHGIRTLEGEISVGTTSHKVMFSSPCPLLIVRY